jgi:hypothetical protein
MLYVLCNIDQWDSQATVKRINELLIERGYVTWFDLTNMKGNTCALAAASVVSFAALQLIGLERPSVVMQEVLWMR